MDCQQGSRCGLVQCFKL